MTKENENIRKLGILKLNKYLVGTQNTKRHEFSFTVDGDEFKGHFHEGEITWMHPYPKQILGEEKEAKIENKIHELLGEHGVSSGINDIEMTQVFEDRPHERRQVTLKVQGDEFKGFVHEGEIQWFHPHPKQKLKDEHVEAIETEIHEKGEDPS